MDKEVFSKMIRDYTNTLAFGKTDTVFSDMLKFTEELWECFRPASNRTRIETKGKEMKKEIDRRKPLATANVLRAPILLSPNVVAVIHIFTRLNHLEDIWMSDVPQYYEERMSLAEAAAKQFISQLGEHWTRGFLKALKKEINICLKKI